MERIAFIYGETSVYWSAIILTLAAAAAVCLFQAFYLSKSGNCAASAIAVPVGFVFSLVLSRLVHWYSLTDSYKSFFSALTDYSSGGFALIGVFAGCLLTAAVLRLLRISRNLPEMLDAMCVSGVGAIAVGRLASFFNASNRGQILEGITSLPWVYPVTNAVSGATEYRLATFVLQAMVAGVIFVGLSIFFLAGMNKPSRRDGDCALLFFLCYGSSQVILDSTRYDALAFRSNGFVSIVQVFSAIALAVALVIFSVRMVKHRRFRFWMVPLWLLVAGLIGGAGYMEYYVQRHGSEAAFAYSVMGGCLLGIVILGILIRALAGGKPEPVTVVYKKGGKYLKK